MFFKSIFGNNFNKKSNHSNTVFSQMKNVFKTEICHRKKKLLNTSILNNFFKVFFEFFLKDTQ